MCASAEEEAMDLHKVKVSSCNGGSRGKYLDLNM